MSHLPPYRLNVPNLGGELTSGVSNPKKRRKNVQSSIPTPPIAQDLLPPPLTGYGDTIVASNPFDDSGSMNVRNPPNMGMGNSMNMVVSNMGMCRPMGIFTTFLRFNQHQKIYFDTLAKLLIFVLNTFLFKPYTFNILLT